MITATYIRAKLVHPGFQKYLKNTGWLFFARICILSINFFTSIYIARSLGPEEYGLLNYVISFASIAGFTLFALDSLLIRKLNHDPQETSAIMGSAFLLKSLNAVVTISIATGAAYFFTTTTTTIFVFAFAISGIFQSFSIIDSYFQAHANTKNVARANIITGLISAALKATLIYLHAPLLFLFLSYTIDQLLMALSYLYFYYTEIGSIRKWSISAKTLRYFIYNSWPFTLSAIATSIYIRIDQLFINTFINAKAVGIYAVAVRFSEVWFFVSTIICIALLPAILNAQKTNHELFLLRSKRLYSLLFYTAISICIATWIIAPLLVTFLYGPEYAQSTVLLRIYIWSIIGGFVGTALQQFLLAQNRFRTILAFNLISMCVSIVVNYLFIVHWGMIGAAVAHIVIYTLPFFCILLFTNMKEQRKAFITAIYKPLS